MICAYVPCSREFVPKRASRKDQRYCCRACVNASRVYARETRLCRRETCRKPFVTLVDSKRSKVYCSKACSDERSLPEITCPHPPCSKVFRPHSRHTVFCSRECASKSRGIKPPGRAHLRVLPDHVCETCSATYHPRHIHQRWCSAPCWYNRGPSKRQGAPRTKRTKPRSTRVKGYRVDLIKKRKQPPAPVWRPWDQPGRDIPDAPPPRKGQRMEQPSITSVNTATAPWVLDRARRTVARYATDPDDLRGLLAMLGLDQKTSSERPCAENGSSGTQHPAEAVNGAPGLNGAAKTRDSRELVGPG